MIQKTTFHFILLLFLSNILYAQTTFDWDNPAPIDSGNIITQTKDGILCTFIGDEFATIENVGGLGGSTGNIVRVGNDVSSVTFTFDQPINVVSILAIDGSSGLSANTFTFTPTGGSNSVVTADNVGQSVSVALNWTGVTSFTVETDVDVLLGFDNLIVQNFPLGTTDYGIENILVFPNPVNDFLIIQNLENIKKASIYNSEGKLILSTKETIIDLSHLSHGIYYLKIRSQNRTEIKRIIKK